VKRFACKLLFVDQAILCGAFVLKVERQINNLRFYLHDLRTGKKLVFMNWEELEEHVEKNSREGLR